MPELELLARLRDAHPPGAPPWWPPAPGWWLLAALVVALALLARRALPPWWRRVRLRRRMLAALDAIARRRRAGARAPDTVAEVSALLREAAIAAFPARDVAGLHGAAWIAFLDASGEAPGRFAALGEALTVAPYARGGEADVPALLAAARAWLKAMG